MHKNWITPESDRYYVATKDTKNDFIEVGVPASQTVATGILILNCSVKTDMTGVGNVNKIKSGFSLMSIIAALIN
jgi:tryptophan synthase alpha subunit